LTYTHKNSDNHVRLFRKCQFLSLNHFHQELERRKWVYKCIRCHLKNWQNQGMHACKRKCPWTSKVLFIFRIRAFILSHVYLCLLKMFPIKRKNIIRVLFLLIRFFFFKVLIYHWILFINRTVNMKIHVHEFINIEETANFFRFSCLSFFDVFTSKPI